MGYKGSPPYVQCIINLILRPHKNYTRYYVDDIVIFFKTFEQHIEHLDTIFELFDALEITLKNVKTYLDYLFIILLRQRVNGFEIFYTKKHITTIRELEFPENLQKLEKYINITG